MTNILMPYGSSSAETKHRSETVFCSYFAHLQELTNLRGINCFSLNAELTKAKNNIALKATAKESKRPESIPLVVWNDKNLRTSGAFYSELIYPILAKGKDAYKPTDEAIAQFCAKLFSGEPINIIQYYTLSKTQSPRRTGSPNHIIDLAEIEMLKHYSLITKTAQELGFNLGFVIVDENDIFPKDELVGGKEEDALVNKIITSNTLKIFGASDKIIIRLPYDSVVSALGDDFNMSYESNFSMFLDKASQEMETGEQTPLAIRMRTFLNVISNKGLESFGMDHKIISEMQISGKDFDIKQLPTDLLNYLLTLTSHVATIMSLRDEAAKKVIALEKISEFPEYDQNSKLYGGVTRSSNRWGFLPNPKKYQGRTINPMHGIAVYSESGEYRGISTFQELSDLEIQNNAEIVRLENKPVFAIVK